MKATFDINEANFDAEVLQSAAPVLVDFWATWCGPCKMLGPVLEEIAQQEAGRVKVVKVNIDENPGLAQRYAIQAVPTLMFFSKGEVRGSLLGAASKKSILSRLAEATTVAAAA